MTFSIIVVCLNAGERLRKTVESVLAQRETDYEVIIKDGGSTDEATVRYIEEQLEQPALADERVRFFRERDAGIYDAMNQAVGHVRGDYVLFLNCGDYFYDENVLGRVKKQIVEVERLGTDVKAQAGKSVERGGKSGKTGERSGKGAKQSGKAGERSENSAEQSAKSGARTAQTPAQPSQRYIFYGDIYEQKTAALVQSNPVIDDFACYRNLPCHQACFYDARLLREKAFDTGYAVRADYEHFLWCYYKARARTVYMPVVVASYEGGGFSETRESVRRSRREHREIVDKYMPADKARRYRFLMAASLAPLRTWIAGNPVTAKVYQTIKRKLYQK